MMAHRRCHPSRPLAAVATLLVMLTTGCNGDAKGTAALVSDEAVRVETAAVTIDDVEITVEAVGTIRANRRVEIRAETEGVVASVLVSDGQDVTVGVPLVQLDAVKLAAEVSLREATLAAARVRARNTQTELRRTRGLLDRGFVPRQEFDDAEAAAEAAAAEVAEAEAALTLARERLADADIRAPIAGMAGECGLDPGDYVQKGDLFLTIIDANPVEVEFSVPEEHLAKLALGRPVSARVPSYRDEVFTGTVTYIEPEVLPDTRSVRLKATIANDDGRLRPGQFATVRAVLAVHAGAVLVPEEAVVPADAATWVYVVENGHAVQRKVTIGVRRTGYVEITSGLEGTETIVVNGQLRLRDGVPVYTVAAHTAQG